MNLRDNKNHDFLKGGGVMGDLIRSKNWSDTELGSPETWPQSLRLVVSILLNSRFPMFVWWGPKYLTIYNDAYSQLAADKHPQALSRPGIEVWSEIWDIIGPLADQVMLQGVSNWSEDQLLYVNRRGYVEECYFTFSYSPVYDESGNVAGVFCACTETTEKVLAARKVEQSERILRDIILKAPFAICILRGETYVVEIANDRMFELWGKSKEELIDKPIFEGLPEAKNQGFEELLEKVFNGGETISAVDVPVTLPRNGQKRLVYVNFVYEPFNSSNDENKGIIAVAHEVTDQVLARKRIEVSEQELQVRVEQRTAELEKQNKLVDNILDNSSNGISVTEMIRDNEGNVVDAYTILANEAAIRFTALPKEIYLTKTARELDPGIMESPYYQMCLSTLKTGVPTISQYFFGYTQRWLEVTVSKMDDDHLIHIFTDVTPIKETQLHLERTIDELQRSNNNLEEFAYAASHDLKEPIRKIQLFSDLLKEKLSGSLDEDQKVLFKRMELASHRMRTLIDDLLAYSHVNEGILHVEDIDLNKKVQIVLEDLEIEVAEKKAKLTIDTLPVISGHRRQIQQVFQNLIGNALKYCKPDIAPQITITCSTVRGQDASIKLSADEAANDFYLIVIKDNGIGFDQQDAERIFNVFTRLHGNSEYRGTGVGLSIVKKVIANHKGYIWAESVPGEGSSFKILLPVGKPATNSNNI